MGRLLRAAAVLAPLLLAACAGCGGESASEAEARAALAADYLAVAFGNRFGPPPPALRKWPGPVVVVRPTGDPSYEDRVFLRLLVRQLDGVLTHARLDLAEWDRRPADLELAYLPRERFATRAPSDPSDELARHVCRADEGGRLTSGLVLLPTDEDVPPYVRQNLTLEGVAACLGLAGASAREHESVFNPEPNWYVTALTPRDLALFALHDRPDLTPGLTRDATAERLRR